MSATYNQLRLAAVLTGLFLATGARADIVSIGDWPCLEWQARRQAHDRVDPPQMWLSGFMTGLATARNVDALAITNASLLFKAMDDFCGQHSEATLASGGQALFEQLRKRLPTTPAEAL